MAGLLLQEIGEDSNLDPTNPILDVYHLDVLLYSPRTITTSSEGDYSSECVQFNKGDYNNEALLGRLVNLQSVRDLIVDIIQIQGVESIIVTPYYFNVRIGRAFVRDTVRLQIFNSLRQAWYPHLDVIEYHKLNAKGQQYLIKFDVIGNTITKLVHCIFVPEGKRLPKNASRKKNATRKKVTI